MKYKLMAALLLSLSLTGCQTIYFEKGSTQNIATQELTWHHGGGIFGLFEFSQPFNPSSQCSGSQWEAVKVDHTFGSAFVSGIVPYGIYTPWAVGARCSQ